MLLEKLMDQKLPALANCQLIVPQSPRKKTLGFTLIEILVVIGVLTVILAIVLIAINPLRQLAETRDTERRSGAKAILDAVYQHLAENGQFPRGMPGRGGGKLIASAFGTGSNFCEDLIPTFIAQMPVDPQNGNFNGCNDFNTSYFIVRSQEDRITIQAFGEITINISLSR